MAGDAGVLGIPRSYSLHGDRSGDLVQCGDDWNSKTRLHSVTDQFIVYLSMDRDVTIKHLA